MASRPSTARRARRRRAVDERREASWQQAKGATVSRDGELRIVYERTATYVLEHGCQEGRQVAHPSRQEGDVAEGKDASGLLPLPRDELASPALPSDRPSSESLQSSTLFTRAFRLHMARGSYAPLATAPTTADNRARAASPSNTSAAHVAAQPATRPSPRAGSSLQSFGQQPSPTPARRRTFLLLFALATVLAASAFLRSSSLRPFSLDRPPAARPADAVMSALSQTAGKRSVG